MDTQNLKVQFSKDKRIIEISMAEGDRIILQTEQRLPSSVITRLRSTAEDWLSGNVPVLILDAGLNLAVVRTCPNKT